MSDQGKSETTNLDALRDAVVCAACRWHDADIYVHPILDRAEAVRVGAIELIEAVERYKNAQPPAAMERSA